MDSRVKDVMTQDVVSVRETAEYKDIVAVMRELRVSAFPVLDEADHLVGVISEADLLLKEVGQEALDGHLVFAHHRGERAKAAGETAAELMSRPAVTIGPGAGVAAAARLMHDRRVKRLPVVDDTGRLVGIVSRADVLSVFDRPDTAICDVVTRDIVSAGVRPRPGRFRRDRPLRHRHHHRAGGEPGRGARAHRCDPARRGCRRRPVQAQYPAAAASCPRHRVPAAPATGIAEGRQ